MTVFEYIKSILDEEYADLSHTSRQPDADVEARLADLSSRYQQLATSKPARVDYSDAATRLAYVYCYVTAHTHIVACAISRCPDLQQLLARDVTISCIGGGPGSDFLGVVHHLLGRGFTGSLQCYLLDREQRWGDNWSDVGTRWPGLTFRVSTYSQSLDVTNHETWSVQKKYLKADLFTFVYFASEIYALANAADYFAYLVEHAKAGALFLFVDNKAYTFEQWIAELVEKTGLEAILTETCDKRLPYDEKALDLEPYRTKFGRSPKLTAQVACRVYRKK